MKPLELVQAPAVKRACGYLCGDTLRLERRLQSVGQRFVEAKDQDRLGHDLGELRAAVSQNHGLARAGDAMNHAVPLAEASSQLLLLQIHDSDDVWELRHIGLKQLRWPLDSDFRKQVVPDPVNLRESQQARERDVKHLPKPLLKVQGIDRLGHFILAYDPVLGNHIAELVVVELLSSDVCQRNAISPRK